MEWRVCVCLDSFIVQKRFFFYSSSIGLLLFFILGCLCTCSVVHPTTMVNLFINWISCKLSFYVHTHTRKHILYLHFIHSFSQSILCVIWYGMILFYFLLTIFFFCFLLKLPFRLEVTVKAVFGVAHQKSKQT